ncbi:MAG TPA: LysR family transcriptional regulator [bacterium]|nr:LysR family transcriptional regulator [bacterium]
MDFSLKVFHTVVKLNSFTQAADILFLTQPAVTFQIKKLEDEFKTTLFIRMHNQISLTESGKILFQYSEQILENYEQAKEYILKTMSELKGEICIGAASLLGNYNLPMILGLFKQKHPDVTIVMYMGDSASVIQSIKEQFFDMAIVSEPVALKQFVISPYFTDELIIIVSSDHPWTRKECLDIEDVLREPCILREKGSGTREVFKRFLRNMNISIHNINTLFTLGSSEAVKSAVESGVGYGIISEIAVKKEIESGILVKVNVNNMKLTRRFLIVYPQKRHKIKIVETFIQFLMEHIPN